MYRNPLPLVDSVVNELLTEELCLKSRVDKCSADRGILPSPTSSMFASFHSSPSTNKNRVQTKVCFDECSFCKQKGHWKAQCPKLLNRAQPSTSSHHWKSGNPPQRQSQSFSSKVAAIVPPVDREIPSNTLITTLAEQFQKFLASQPHAMFASSPIGFLSNNTSGILPLYGLLIPSFHNICHLIPTLLCL